MNWIQKILNRFMKRIQFPAKQSLDESTIRWRRGRRIRSKGDIFSLRKGVTGNTKILRRSELLAKEERYIFLVIAGLDRGREYIGTTCRIGVGRHPENLILLRDPKVSRFHAVFHRRGSKLFFEDLGSTNGTRVNGERIFKKKQVFPNDQIKIGETVIQITLEKK